MDYIGMIPSLPEVEISDFSDEFGEKVFSIFRIEDVRRAELLEEDENPYETVSVTLKQDFVHSVAKRLYSYRAFQPKEVPKNVALILKELGLLYTGGELPPSVRPNEKKDWVFDPRGREEQTTFLEKMEKIGDTD